MDAKRLDEIGVRRTVQVWNVEEHLHCPYCGRVAPRVVGTETYWCQRCDATARFQDGYMAATWERGEVKP